MRTDKDKAQLRAIQMDTLEAIYLTLKSKYQAFENVSEGHQLGYLQAIDHITTMSHGDLDKFRQYNTQGA